MATELKMNAITLGILLHYYWSPEVYPSRGSQTEINGVHWLIKHGYLDANQDKDACKITLKGECYVKACLDLPEPIMSWNMPK